MQNDFNGIPPALIILATQDILYTDGKLYSDFCVAVKASRWIVNPCLGNLSLSKDQFSVGPVWHF